MAEKISNNHAVAVKQEKKQLNNVSVSRKISKSTFKIEFCEGLLCSACIFIYFQTNMNKCFFFMCLHVHLKSHMAHWKHKK